MLAFLKKQEDAAEPAAKCPGRETLKPVSYVDANSQDEDDGDLQPRMDVVPRDDKDDDDVFAAADDDDMWQPPKPAAKPAVKAEPKKRAPKKAPAGPASVEQHLKVKVAKREISKDARLSHRFFSFAFIFLLLFRWLWYLRQQAFDGAGQGRMGLEQLFEHDAQLVGRQGLPQ